MTPLVDRRGVVMFSRGAAGAIELGRAIGLPRWFGGAKNGRPFTRFASASASF